MTSGSNDDTRTRHEEGRAEVEDVAETVQTAVEQPDRAAEAEAGGVEQGGSEGGPQPVAPPAAAVAAAHPPRRAGFFGRALTGLVMGVVGGFAAIAAYPYAAPFLSERLGIPDAHADLRQTVTVIERRLDGFETKLSQVSAGVAPLKQVEAVQKGLADLKRDAEAIDGRVSANGTRLATLNEAVKKLRTAAVSGNLTEVALAQAIKDQLKDFEQAIDGRISEVTKAADKARATLAERLDGDVKGLVQKVAAVETDVAAASGGVDKITGRIDDLLKELEALKALKTAVAALNEQVSQIKVSAVDAEEVSKQIAALQQRADKLESLINTALERQEKDLVQAKRLALLLALGDLHRAINSGQSYAAELATVKKLAPAGIDFSGLDKLGGKPIATVASLKKQFGSVAKAVLLAAQASGSGSIIDRIWDNAKGIVTIRKVGYVEGADVEAVVARMESKLQTDGLAGAVEEAKGLSGKSLDAAKSWLDAANARLTAERLLSALKSKVLEEVASGGTGDQKEG